jgi:hypothetical protein
MPGHLSLGEVHQVREEARQAAHDVAEAQHQADVQSWQAAVAAATAGNRVQQRQAVVWFDASLPTDPQAHTPVGSNAPNL